MNAAQRVQRRLAAWIRADPDARRQAIATAVAPIKRVSPAAVEKWANGGASVQLVYLDAVAAVMGRSAAALVATAADVVASSGTDEVEALAHESSTSASPIPPEVSMSHELAALTAVWSQLDLSMHRHLLLLAVTALSDTDARRGLHPSGRNHGGG